MEKTQQILNAIQEHNFDYAFHCETENNKIFIYNRLFLIRIEFLNKNDAVMYKKWKGGLIGELLLRDSFKKTKFIYDYIYNLLVKENMNISEIYLNMNSGITIDK